MVATALTDISPGDEAGVFSGENILIRTVPAVEKIPFGHKIALRDIEAGEKILKYGAAIGECTRPIGTGCLVHVHNVKSLCVDIPPAFKREIMRQMGLDFPLDAE